MLTAQRTIRGVTYEVDAAELRACEAVFDAARDGLGVLSGPLGRAAFLHLTARAVLAVHAHDPADPFGPRRLLKVLRSRLASRGSGAVQDERSPRQRVPGHSRLGSSPTLPFTEAL